MLSTLLVISEEGISGRPNNGAESNCTNGGRVSSSFCLGLLNYMHSPHGLSSESLGAHPTNPVGGGRTDANPKLLLSDT